MQKRSFQKRSIKVFCELLFIKFPFLDPTVYSVNKTALRTLGHGAAVFKPSFTSCHWWQQRVARVSPLHSSAETHILVMRGVLLRVAGEFCRMSCGEGVRQKEESCCCCVAVLSTSFIKPFSGNIEGGVAFTLRLTT